MRKALSLVVVFSVLWLVHQTAFAQIHFTARLDGAQEVPPVTTTATGTGTFTLNSAGTELTYHVTFAGLSGPPTLAHFHNGPAGGPGGPVRDIFSTISGNTASGSWKSNDANQPLTPALLNELLGGRIYVNFHTAANGGGEIRGQLQVDYGIGFSARLDGAQEVPPVTTNATGTGSFVLKSSSSGTVTELEYHVTFAGLSGPPTLAHFHNGPAGGTGNPVRDIFSSISGNTASGSWKSDDANQPLTPALLTELLAGRIYVNFHTAANGGGEIRGQVLVTTGIGFTAKLDGAQETPQPINTPATGTGSFTLNNDATELAYDITVAGFGSRITNAHFHNGLVGVTGGVVRNLNFLATGATGISATAAGVWKSSDATQPLTSTLLNELLNGNIYVNFHTSANSGGEIRGQLKLNLGISFTAKLTGLQEAPTPVISRASGTAACVLADGGNELTYQVTYANLSSSFRFAHFHNAAAGISAGVVRDISFNGNTAAGSWKSSDANQPLSSILLLELLGGRLYVNVHSNNFGSGEIRGQVVRDVNTLPLLTTIGASRTLVDSTVNVNLQGVITTIDFQLSSTSGTEYYFQDPTGGLRLFIRGKAALLQGTEVLVKNGFVYTFNGRKNIEVQANQVEILGTPGLPAPQIVTIQGYKANQAAIEGQYIGITAASLKSGTWPAAGSNATVFLSDASTGSADSLAMFIDSDTDIDGSTPPTSPFDVLGVATQFQATGQAQGTPQIQPSLRADFRPAGTVSVAETKTGFHPETFALRQNYPNPFNPVTNIEFMLGRTQLARLAVYDVMGREVVVLFNGHAEAGKVYQFSFNGARRASGIYFYRLESAEKTQIRKMLLSK